MGRRLALLLLCAVSIGGCSAIESPYSVPPYAGSYTVSEAVEQRAKLEGERINIIGVLEACQPLSCGITQGEYRLSLGASREFDKRAGGFEGEEVLIAATFQYLCINDPVTGLITACTDRPATLAEPTLLGLARFFRS